MDNFLATFQAAQAIRETLADGDILYFRANARAGERARAQ